MIKNSFSNIDTTSISDTINQFLSQGLPFVIFSEPNSLTVRCFYQTDQTVYPFKKETLGFVVAPFSKESKDTFVIPNKHSTEWRTPDKKHLSIAKFTKLKTHYDRSKKNYKKLVKKSLEQIHKKDLKKIVVARKESILSNVNHTQSFLNSLHIFPNAFNYMWYHPKIGMWIGASPEKLFSIKNYILKTVSLASTKKSRISKKKWSKKEYLEQEIVTEWIKTKLKKHGISITTKGPETYQIGELVHLKTSFEGTIPNNFNSSRFLEDLHPTPAVCGTPSKKVKQFLCDYEEIDRGYYTGFIGVYEGVRLQSYFVNIRCAELKQMETILYGGCGVVKGSKPNCEWQETVSKIESIKNILVSF